MKVLHFSPHPDDEILGAGGTLLELQRSGWEVSNWALTLGSTDQHRREEELLAANQILDYQLFISAADYRGKASNWPSLDHYWRQEYSQLPSDFDLFIAPSPLDGHPGHEAVGRLALALASSENIPIWFWGLWADLPLTNLLAPVSEDSYQQLNNALEAHRSQLADKDWQQLLDLRQRTQALLGPERIFGWQQAPESPPRAETLLSVMPQTGQLIATEPQVVDFSAPLQAEPRGRDLSQLLLSPSWNQRLLTYR